MFVKELKKQVEIIHSHDPKGKETYVRIINKKHFNRLNEIIHRDKIYYGGDTDENQLYISPTILDNVSFDDKVILISFIIIFIMKIYF